MICYVSIIKIIIEITKVIMPFTKIIFRVITKPKKCHEIKSQFGYKQNYKSIIKSQTHRTTKWARPGLPGAHGAPINIYLY